jgi:hypothetical protein
VLPAFSRGIVGPQDEHQELTVSEPQSHTTQRQIQHQQNPSDGDGISSDADGQEHQENHRQEGSDSRRDDSDSLSDDGLEGELGDSQDESGPGAAAMVTDSYGRSRFIGGATNLMLIDAAQNPSPQTQKTATPGSAAAAATAGNMSSAVDEPVDEHGEAEIPLFVRGRMWPQLPWLPRPEQLTRPPQYVSDLLVGLFFDRMHYTLPVLFKPHFMTRYRRMLARGSGRADEDPEFLLIFFAVCACAHSMLPEGRESGLPGLEYFEKALLLSYASHGQVSIERIQCLALLAMCSAGWNTLTKSWSLAGQAVRDAVDIGLHLSSQRVRHMGTGTHLGADHTPSAVLQRQISRRLWWCVYSLDRVVSICLGRPFAVDDRDCACDLPWDLSDEDLQRQCRAQAQAQAHARSARSAADPPSVTSIDPPLPPPPSSPMTGFIAFARLCRIAGKIQRLGSPSSLLGLSASSGNNKARLLAARVVALDRDLREWLDNLPDSIRFSANQEINAAGPGSDPSLVMCVIIFMMHAGSLLNLYWCLLLSVRLMPPEGNEHSAGLEPKAAKDAVLECISAAHSAINAAELVRDLVPPSHALAICVHCLTLSGVAL